MRKFILLFFLFTGHLAVGQSTNAPLNRDYYHLIDRYEILSGSFSPSFHSTAKPYQRQDIAAFVDSMITQDVAWNKIDEFNLEYLSNDNWEWSSYNYNDSKKPFLKKLYEKKSDFYHVGIKDFDLHLNPVFHFGYGTESASEVNTFTNSRGLALRGLIADRVGFYSFLTENQAIYPDYVREYVDGNLVIPYEGFWKQYKDNGYDFFTAKGYISFDLIKKYINLQFGFDKMFRGNGQRSFVLSDFSNNYTFLKLNTKIWRINYTNLFTQIYADVKGGSVGTYYGPSPKKFMASHHLSINISDNFNLGLFESVIIGDSTGTNFDISYLNPIIFYRALEHQGGSAENILVGLDFKWNFAYHFSLYGQFMLDEFYLKEIKAQDGWWANKFGSQLGLKYINAFGLLNFDLVGEMNIARPYTYQHTDVYTNYAHYRMPLGHALGANFYEFVGGLKYQPHKRLTISSQLIYSEYGADTLDSNWGKDVMQNYTTREQEYGNTIGQGVETKLLYGSLVLSYQFKQNIFVDLSVVYRDLDSALDPLDRNTTYFSGAFRWNIPRTVHDF